MNFSPGRARLVFDAATCDAIEAEVAAVEARTSAEIVVVLASSSGPYRDVAMLAASIAVLIELVLLLFLPFSFHPAWVAVDVAVSWPLLVWGFEHPWFLRRATSAARRRAQVDHAAAAEMHTESVTGTPDRTGILIYVSALERDVVVRPDAGVSARVAPGEFAPAIRLLQAADLDGIRAGLRLLGDVLQRSVPTRPGDDGPDLPNRPRIRR